MPLEIYYLDDEPELCDIFSEYFASEEVRIRTFTEAEALLEACRKRSPDAAFLDYRLKNGNGEIVAKQLPPNFPKYLLTGELAPEVKEVFNAVFKKPIEFTKINETIRLLKKTKDQSAISG